MIYIQEKAQAITSRIFRVAGRALASSLVLPAALALGQESGSTGSTEDGPIEEIVVQGTWRYGADESTAATILPLRLKDTPQSLSIVTEDLLDTIKAFDLEDVVVAVPGVHNRASWANTRSQLNSRGFEISPNTGYLQNGVVVPHRTDIDPAVIERMEFVRGPNAIVTGENGYGGTVNFVTKRASPGTHRYAGIEARSFGFYRSEFDFNGQLTEDDRIAARLSGAVTKRGNFIDNADADRFAVAPTVAWDFAERSRLELYGFYQSEQGGAVNGLPLVLDENLQLQEPDIFRRELNIVQPWSRYSTEARQLVADLHHGFFDDWDARVTVGVQEAELRLNNGFPFGIAAVTQEGCDFLFATEGMCPNLAGDGPGIPGDQEVFLDNRVEPSETKIANVVLLGDFEMFGRDQQFVLQGSYQKLDRTVTINDFVRLGIFNMFNPNYDLPPPAQLPPNPLVDFTETQDKYAVGGQVLFQLLDRFKLLVGGTWNEFEESTGFRDGRAATNTSFSEFTARAGGIFELTPDVNLFVSMSEGFLDQSQRRFRDGSILPPETGRQWEGGVKADLRDGALQVSAAYFHTVRENVAVTDPCCFPSIFSLPVGEQENTGYELEVVGRLTPNMNVLINYAHIDVEVIQTGAASLLLGFPESVPKDSGTVFVEYTLDSGPLSNLSLVAGVVAVGERNVDNQETFQNSGYTRLDLSASYPWSEGVELGFGVMNVTDERWHDSAFGGAGEGQFPGEPRAYIVSLGYSF